MEKTNTNIPHMDVFMPADAEIGNSPVVDSPPTVTAPDPFDPSRLRLSQNMTAALGVKKHLTTIPRAKAVEGVVCSHPSRSNIQAGDLRYRTQRRQ